MAKRWSNQAVREQKDLNRFTEGLQIREEDLQGRRQPTQMTIVRSRAAIAPNQAGLCEFLAGTLAGPRVGTGEQTEMYNLATDVAIPEDVDCLASRIMLSQAGEAGWALHRVVGANVQTASEFTCAGCVDDKMPQIRIAISGLVDLAGDATYDGWADVVNGTHSMDHSVPCFPVLHFVVPDNRPLAGGTGHPLIGGFFQLGMASAWLAQPLTHISFRQGGARAQLSSVVSNVIFQESSSGAGLMSRTLGKIDCTQTYSNYADIPLGAGSQFASWLSAGTFQINPP